MEYFVPIIQNKHANHDYSNYEVSNLGNVRRIGTTTTNLEKHCGEWRDCKDQYGKYNPDYRNHPIIDDEDVEATIFKINNIKKIHIKDDKNMRKLNSIEAKYKEIRTVVNVYGDRYSATNMLKANLGFGIKKYEQDTKPYEIVAKKQNNPKIPYGTIFVVKNNWKLIW